MISKKKECTIHSIIQLKLFAKTQGKYCGRKIVGFFKKKSLENEFASFQSLSKKQQENFSFRKRQQNNKKINVLSESSIENLEDEKKFFS